MTIKPSSNLTLKHPINPINRTIKSFMNFGRTIADISFQSTTSTGVKGVQYLVKKKRYRVIWKKIYVAYVLDLDKAVSILQDYLISINESDRYRENKDQVARHLTHIKNTTINK
ncbi:MAG TPA: hypothetical protein EYP92_04255 [Candidatus Thioglobus sp.]|nr:hypothetical protein [Candidatus Thioglobus sp.]